MIRRLARRRGIQLAKRDGRHDDGGAGRAGNGYIDRVIRTLAFGNYRSLRELRNW